MENIREKLISKLPPIPVANLVRETGKSKKGPCPKCGGHDRFVLRTDTGQFHCRKCHPGQGGVIDYHMWVGGLTYSELCEKYGIGNNGSKGEIPGEIKAVYDYTDQGGKILFQVVRYEPKTFRQRRPDGKGGYVWNLKGVETILYHLPELSKADEVIITEGEKDADALRSLGFIATTPPMGAGKWRESYNQSLRGKDVVILPDNDEPGRDHAEKIARLLSGVASTVKVVSLEGLPEKGDASDWIEQRRSEGMPDEDIAERLAVIIDSAKIYEVGKDSEPIGFDRFLMNGMAADMEKQMESEIHVLKNLALTGQWTVWYAPPNMGKTLMIICLLIEAIKSKRIKGENVFFVNADDTHPGLVYKLKIAEKYGFGMLSPGYNGFKAEMLTQILYETIKANVAKNKIVILDTVKKFTDIMNKTEGRKFGVSIREFVSYGGTIIALAHTNKNRGGDGKLIYAGTSDLIEDCDCAYTIDKLDENETRRQITFENIKCRGNVSPKAVYEYDHRQDTNYQARIDSVREISTDEYQESQRKAAIRKRIEKNRETVIAIITALQEGINRKTEIVKLVNERTYAGQKSIHKVLKEFTGDKVDDGKFWRVNIGDKNTNIFHLNYGFETMIF